MVEYIGMMALVLYLAIVAVLHLTNVSVNSIVIGIVAAIGAICLGIANVWSWPKRN